MRRTKKMANPGTNVSRAVDGKTKVHSEAHCWLVGQLGVQLLDCAIQCISHHTSTKTGEGLESDWFPPKVTHKSVLVKLFWKASGGA